MPLAAREIRERFLRFFEARSHRIVPSASVVPESDPTLMFVNSGMVPFKRIFLGEEVRPYTRAVSSQKCMRVSGKHNDLEAVGRSPRHHTFFEMLGNFSFGDYFKQGAIEFAWEFLTQDLGISEDRLVVSVFREDAEAFDLWRDRIGLSEERIFRLDEAENFWSMGDTGPCGPCSEIHIDYGPVPGFDNDDPSSESGRYLEIWNLVFMQYDRDASGQMTPLPNPCVDTGAGLERLTRVVQGVSSTYETDVFTDILARVQQVTGVQLGGDAEKDVSLRVAADHARAVTFLIGDGVLPSNEGRGYVLRRILRRASRHGVLLGKEEPFLYAVADAVIDNMCGAYPDLSERRPFIVDRVRREEERFLVTLSRGLARLEDAIDELQAKGGETLSGDEAFRLYDTYGFPVDLTEDILQAKNLRVDHSGFEAAMLQQRERARAAWKGSGDSGISEVYGRIAAGVATEFCGYEALDGRSTVAALLVNGELVDVARSGDKVEVVVPQTPFYAESGGQVGDRGLLRAETGRVEVDATQRPVENLVVHLGRVVEGEIRADSALTLSVDRAAREATVRNHTGTHLLHAALRQVLGPQAMQKGSLVTPDRLRFDFTHDSPLSDEEVDRIEDLANSWIEANAAGSLQIMSYAEAVESGAVALFEEKYGDEVRVVSFGDFSTELCGGTHANATGDIGVLKIVSESSIASGVRRIEALTGLNALRYMRSQERALAQVAGLLKTPLDEVPARVEKLLAERRSAQREIDELKLSQRGAEVGDVVGNARDIEGGKALAARVDGADAKTMRQMTDDFRNRLGSGVVMLAAESDGKVLIAIGVTKDLTGRYKAGDLIRETAKVVGGGGGGRPDFAQAGGKDASKIDAAIEKFYQLVVGA